MPDRLQSLLRIAAAITLLAAFILLPFFLFGSDLERWTIARIGVRDMAAALAGGILLALDIVLPIPSSLVATAMGALLGGWAGALVNAVGLTAGCLLGLLIGRTGSPLASRILGPELYARFVAWIARNGVAAVLLCRAVPVLAEASIVAAGAGRGRVAPLLAAATLADICLGVMYAFAGAAAGPAAAPSAPAFAAAIGIPVAASIASILWMRRRSGG